MMTPNEDRVLLKPIPPEETTSSGIIIPLEAQKVEIWEVVAIGPTSTSCRKCGTDRPTELKPGMLVLINESAGMDFSDNGEKLRIVRFTDIHAYDDKK